MKTASRGFMLATALLLIPICLILTFSLVKLINIGAGFGLQQQQKMKAFYLAEAGLNTGFHLFGLHNFSGVTHDPTGSAIDPNDPMGIICPAPLNLVNDGNGWLSWSYTHGVDPRNESFTQSQMDESYKIRIWFPDSSNPNLWQIDCEAVVGNRRAQHQMSGVLEDPQEYLIFDNGDLADLSRSSAQSLEGKIHTNGDIYVAPWETYGFEKNGHYIVAPSATSTGTTLTSLSLENIEISSGGDLIRRRDFWGRTDSGIQVNLNGVSLGTNSSNYYDSESPLWNNTGAAGALAQFSGQVRTRDVGARQKSPPHSQVFEPGGYYNSQAGLVVDSNTASNSWLQKVVSYNEAERQQVRVSEIDIKALHASGHWPENGLLYASTPLRITNGSVLPEPLTIVSSETVYLQGDFNKKFHNSIDQSTNNSKLQPAAIMTADRVYRISDDFQDKPNSEYLFPLTDPDLFIQGHPTQDNGSKMRPAQDPPKFPGDPNNVIEHNAVIVDSTPTEDTAAFAFADQGHPSVYNPGLKVRLSADPNTGETEFVFPSSEDFLENVSGLRFEHGGSEIHLRNATMVSGPYNGMFNEGFPAGIREGSGPTAYVQRSHYIAPTSFWHQGPMAETPGIFRKHDSNAVGLAGRLLPYALKAARQTFWQAK